MSEAAGESKNAAALPSVLSVANLAVWSGVLLVAESPVLSLTCSRAAEALSPKRVVEEFCELLRLQEVLRSSLELSKVPLTFA